MALGFLKSVKYHPSVSQWDYNCRDPKFGADMGTALATKEHSVYRYIQPPTSLPHLHLHQLDYSEDLRRVKDRRKATSTTLEVY